MWLEVAGHYRGADGRRLHSRSLAGGAVWDTWAPLRGQASGGRNAAHPHFLLRLPDHGKTVTLQPSACYHICLPHQNGMAPLGLSSSIKYLARYFSTAAGQATNAVAVGVPCGSHVPVSLLSLALFLSHHAVKNLFHHILLL